MPFTMAESGPCFASQLGPVPTSSPSLPARPGRYDCSQESTPQHCSNNHGQGKTKKTIIAELRQEQGRLFKLEGREPPLTLRQEKQYLYFGHLSPVRQGLFGCSTALFLKNSHREGPVLQAFGLVLRAGIWHSTSVVQALPWG